MVRDVPRKVRRDRVNCIHEEWLHQLQRASRKPPSRIHGHFTAYEPKKAESDPMVDGRDIGARGEAERPSKQGGNSFDDTEHETTLGGLQQRRLSARATSHRGGAGIGRHAEGENGNR